jgi:hypothetical protein
MSSTMKLHVAPTYSPVQLTEETKLIAAEIQKVSPLVELSLADSTALARGNIVVWDTARKFFRVHRVKSPKSFEDELEKDALRPTYFKVHLLSSQLVFKAQVIRRSSELSIDYQIPETIYKQQRRGSMRVPLTGLKARLEVGTGKSRMVIPCKVTDLSITGARLVPNGAMPKLLPRMEAEVELLIPERPATLRCRIAYSSEEAIGCRFQDVHREALVPMKHFLIESLRQYFSRRTKTTL